jgi:hypothetical protein
MTADESKACSLCLGGHGPPLQEHRRTECDGYLGED